MNNDPRGIISRQGNIMRINNALVEDVFTSNNVTGFIIISYADRAPNQRNNIQTVRLNITRNTVLLNAFGRNMCICDIRVGMFIDAVFSSFMTRSIPPQTNAFLVIARRNIQPPSNNITTARIARIDAANGFIYTGNRNDINSQTRFTVSEATTITDQIGRLVDFNALRPGQNVRITHANFMTASIPPQTAAFHIQIL